MCNLHVEIILDGEIVELSVTFSNFRGENARESVPIRADVCCVRRGEAVLECDVYEKSRMCVVLGLNDAFRVQLGCRDYIK